MPECEELPRPTTSPTPKAGQHAMAAPYQGDKFKGGVTYAHQDQLPKLPVPDLERSCEKYLAALKPLQSPREHAETRYAVQEFLRNEGPELNEKLKNYAEGRTSYIEQFCMFSIRVRPQPRIVIADTVNKGTTRTLILTIPLSST